MAANKRRRTRKRWGFKQQTLGIFGLLTAIVFMPTTMLLFFGMLPTVVAAVIDRSGRNTKALTVGAMNFAGCIPFLIQLWTEGNDKETAAALIMSPRTVIVIYCAAGVGYLINWAMAGIVTTIMVQRSGSRLKDIKKKEADLVTRWGPEVTGDLVLDAYGFPINGVEAETVVKEVAGEEEKEGQGD